MAANVCDTRRRFEDHAAAIAAGSAAAKPWRFHDPAAASHYESTFTKFCATFPDTFFCVRARPRFLDPKSEKELTGRFLSAGLHNQMGYFRDDGPFYSLMLGDSAAARARSTLGSRLITSRPFPRGNTAGSCGTSDPNPAHARGMNSTSLAPRTSPPGRTP